MNRDTNMIDNENDYGQELRNAMEDENQHVRNSFFYVFIDEFAVKQKKKNSASFETSHQLVGNNLDELVHQAFLEFHNAYVNETQVTYLKELHYRQYFSINTLPAFSVADEWIDLDKIDEFIRSTPEKKRQPNLFQRLLGKGGEISQFVTFQRDILKAYEGRKYELFVFIRDIHMRILDDGVSSIHQKWVMTKTKHIAGEATRVGRQAIETGRKLLP